MTKEFCIMDAVQTMQKNYGKHCLFMKVILNI